MIIDIPNWSAPKQIKAVTTTRLGGVSSSPHDSLNLGDHVQDSLSCVNENRNRLSIALSLPGEPIWLKQVHSPLVIDLDTPDGSLMAEGSLIADGSLMADGSITARSGVVCAVLTADCLPLFLCDRAGTQVAIVHAGWRGMADGIIEAGVAAFNVMPDQIIAWAGPCISAQHFEIGPEVRTALGGAEDAYRESVNQGKLLADLYQLAGDRLAALGVRDYGHSSACTYQDKQRYFSYRRDGECGRMASLIWIDS